jgi:lysophospholipase L1-like esterase
MKTILSLATLLVAVLASHAQSFTISYDDQASHFTGASTVAATDTSVFTYCGFATTNPALTYIYSKGISSASEMQKLPPVQVMFDVTGTSFELVMGSHDYINGTDERGYFTLSDGITTTLYTNSSYIGPATYIPNYTLVTFTNGGTHHMTLSVKGGFKGVNVTSATVSKRVLSPKPNLLIVLGDSYTEGYNPTVSVFGVVPSYWFDGWVWQLAQLASNTVPVQCAVSGTGFIAGSPTVHYGARVVSDVCGLYTNALNSGIYNNIFITASGTINDRGADTNALFIAVTNIYATIKAACPQAKIFVLGNWYGAGGASSPGAADFANDTVMSTAASIFNLPYFSPSKSASALLTSANYNLFFPSGITDSVHPSAAGYAVMAKWMHTNMVATFGTNWSASAANGAGTIYYSLTVNDGSGSGNYTAGQSALITATAKLGYAFSSWSGPNITDPTQASTTVTMPASNIAVTANYVSSSLPTNFNVLNFGASGDVVKLTVKTTSNSPVVSVIGTNRFSSADIGKVIQVFRAGPWITYSNWGPVVTNQDIVCLITNVSNGTDLSLSIPCGWTTNAYCVVGTNNAPAFQAAINAASNVIASAMATNVVISIPPGTYLLVSPYVLIPSCPMSSISDTHPAIYISSGGITLQGNSTNDTVLMGCGAGMNHFVNANLSWISSGYAPYVPMRDTLIYCYGPIQHNELPLIFQNLTFDGGLTNGLLNYRYWTIKQGNGDGWDTTHHCLADSNPFPSTPQMHQMKVFTNCVFQHWRGEILICWTAKGGTNTFNDIANCLFQDGSASAINLYYGQHIHGCTFSGLDKVEEFYQFNASLPSVFENNVWTNILGNPFSIVGSTTNENAQSYTLQNNIMYGMAGINQIHFAPAANISVIGNQFFGQAPSVAFSGLGVQPSDGSATIITNILIACNSFNDSAAPITMDGYPVSNVLISNNTSTVIANNGAFASAGGGWKTNILFVNNTAPAPLDGRGIQAGSYFIDSTNNSFGTLLWDNGWYGNPAYITYAAGRLHGIANAAAVFALNDDDSTKSMIPPGAILTVTNMDKATATVYGSAKTYITQPSGSTGPKNFIAPGQSRSYQWDGNYWRVIVPEIRPTPGFK